MLPHHDQPQFTPAWCRPQSRCRAWRHCLTCARIRQAKIADAAERLAKLYPALQWSALHPLNPGADNAIAARAEFIRKLDPPAAIWTVEQSPSTGNLHVNIIHPGTTTAILAKSKLWTTTARGDIRQIAAYISKPDQYPRRQDFPGRLYGTCGPLWSYLAHPDQEPPVAAAALQYTIDPEPMTLRAFFAAARRERLKLQRNGFRPPEPVPTKEEAREIAARWLPDILETWRPRRDPTMITEDGPNFLPRPD